MSVLGGAVPQGHVGGVHDLVAVLADECSVERFAAHSWCRVGAFDEQVADGHAMAVGDQDGGAFLVAFGDAGDGGAGTEHGHVLPAREPDGLACLVAGVRREQDGVAWLHEVERGLQLVGAVGGHEGDHVNGHGVSSMRWRGVVMAAPMWRSCGCGCRT